MGRGYQIFPRGKKFIENFDDIFKPEKGAVAQMEEHLAGSQEVEGSTPSRSTKTAKILQPKGARQ